MTRLKVVLIDPITTDLMFTPLLGLGFIANSLEQAGYKVSIINANAIYGKYTINKLYREVKEIGPDIIGFSFCTESIPFTYQQIKAVKGLAKITIAGGQHTTAVPEEVLNNGADIVLIGEGEETVVDFIKTWESGGNWEEVKGIGLKRNNEVIINSSRPLIHDLDRLKVARHLVKYENFARNGGQRLFENILTSRGCPAKCTFCSSSSTMGKKTVRFRSAENVVDEILELTETLNFGYIRIVDDTFTWDKERTQKICNMLLESSRNKIRWSCSTRVNKVDQDLLLLMKEAGCFRITFGLESIIPDTLKKIKKGISVERAVKAARDTVRAGMDAKLNTIQGWPWERPEDVDKTVQFVEEIAKEGIIFNTRAMVIPYPRTELYNEYNQQYGFTNWWLKEKIDIKANPNYVKPFFLSGLIGTFYDDPVLENDFFKYSYVMKKKYKKLMNCKAESFKVNKGNFVWNALLNNLYFLSKFLHWLNPLLERIIFKILKEIATSMKISRI